MKRERELERRLQSLDSLGGAIGAMKDLSAHHVREAKTALEPARRYREGLRGPLATAGASLPGWDGPVGLLVLGSDLGVCGAYNSAVVALASEHRGSLGGGPTFCVGRRASALLGRYGVRVARSYAAPASVRGVTAALLGIAEDMLVDYVADRMSAFDVVSSRFEGVGAHRAIVTRLLPLEVQPSSQAAARRYVSEERLAEVSVRELLYVTMYGLLVEALAAEHGARLGATQAAERWIEERADLLRRHLAAARREVTTQEVIEIATGALARRRGPPRPA